MSDVTITEDKSAGCIWNQGDLLAWYEPPKEREGAYLWSKPVVSKPASYLVMLCTAEREVGPRGGLRAPARTVTIKGPTWGAVCNAVCNLGFTRPTVTATRVREGW